MADKEYEVEYIMRVDKAIADLVRLQAALANTQHAAVNLDVILHDLGRGAGRTLNPAARAVDRLGTSLNDATSHASRMATALTAVGASARGIGGHITAAGRAVAGLDTRIGAMLGRIAGVAAMVKVVRELGEAWKEAREWKEGVAEESLDKRDKARELANLMGEEGPNDKVMGRIFSVALASTLDYDETLKFLEQAEGSIPAGIKKGNVREDQKKEVFQAGAVAAARLGLDPATGGDITGVMAQHIDLNNQKDATGRLMSAAEAVAAQFEAMAYGANEGRGKLTVLMRGEAAQAASAMAAGRVGSLGEMGAFIGTASTMSKTGAYAGTAFSQLDNALNRTEGDAGDFLKQIGVGDAKGDRNKLMALKAHIDAVKPADVNTYLAEKGFESQAERKSVVGFLANTAVLDKTIAEAEKRAQDPATAQSKNQAFIASVDAQNRLSKVRNEAADFAEGTKHDTLMVARRDAMARLKTGGAFNEREQLVADKVRGGFGLAEFVGLPPEIQNRIDREVFRNLEAKAGEKGIDLQARGFADLNRAQEGGLLPKRLDEALEAMHAEGVDVFGGDAGLKQKMELMEQGVDAGAAFDPRKPLPAGRRVPQAPGAAKGAPGAGGPAGAGAAPGNAHAAVQVDAQSLDRAAAKLERVADKMTVAIRDGALPPFPGGMNPTEYGRA